jgi:hypothetical protein
MTGERFRLATKTLRDGKQETHVSTVVLSEREAVTQLKAEIVAHLMAGWNVTVKTNGTVVCQQHQTRREIRSIRFTPMDDVSIVTISE